MTEPKHLTSDKDMMKLCSFLFLYHANKRLERKEENFDEADEGETHAESEHSPNVCNESCR